MLSTGFVCEQEQASITKILGYSGGKGFHSGISGVERYAYGAVGTSVGCEYTGKHPDPEAERECRQALQRLRNPVRK